MEQKKIIDVTGVELTPGEPSRCKGNGKDYPMTCCCDECDFFLKCFLEWDENGSKFKEMLKDPRDMPVWFYHGERFLAELPEDPDSEAEF